MRQVSERSHNRHTNKQNACAAWKVISEQNLHNAKNYKHYGKPNLELLNISEISELEILLKQSIR